MSTSGNELKKHLIYNLAGSAFLAVFGAIYEQFSHEVYSPFMIFAFAVPLVFGAAPYAAMLLMKKHAGRAFLNLWNSGIAALSVGSLFRGALEIYGTTNSLLAVYPVAGTILYAAAIAAAITEKKRNRKKFQSLKSF